MSGLDLQAGGWVLFTDSVDEAVEALKPGLAFSLGAMGSQEFNFYNAAYSRAGYADEAKAIQRLWLDGRRDEARKLVPSEMILKSNLLGTDEMVKQRIRAYRDAGVTSLSASLRFRAVGRGGLEAPTLRERIEILGHLMDLVNEVNEEPFTPPWEAWHVAGRGLRLLRRRPHHQPGPFGNPDLPAGPLNQVAFDLSISAFLYSVAELQWDHGRGPNVVEMGRAGFKPSA